MTRALGTATSLVFHPLVALVVLVLFFLGQIYLTIDSLFVFEDGVWYAIPYTGLTDPRLATVSHGQFLAGLVALALYCGICALGSFYKGLREDEKIQPLVHLVCAIVVGVDLVVHLVAPDGVSSLRWVAVGLAAAASVTWWIWVERRVALAKAPRHGHVSAWAVSCIGLLILVTCVRAGLGDVESVSSSGRFDYDMRWIGGVYDFGRHPDVDCLSAAPTFPADGDSFLFVTTEGRGTDDPARAVALDPDMAHTTEVIDPVVDLHRAIAIAESISSGKPGGKLRRLLLLGEPDVRGSVVRRIGDLAAEYGVEEILLLKPSPFQVEGSLLRDLRIVDYCVIGVGRPYEFSYFEGESLRDLVQWLSAR